MRNRETACISHTKTRASRFAIRHSLFAIPIALLASGVAFADPGTVDPENPAFKAISMGTFLGGMSLFFIGLVALPLAAMVIVLTLARPKVSDRLSEIVAHQRATAFWWGLATTILFLFAFAAFSKPLGVLALLLLMLYSWSLLVGFMGVARQTGELLRGDGRSVSASPALLTLIGSLLLTGAAAVPLFGWLIAVYVVCLSVGAFRLGWHGPKTAQEQSAGPSAA